MQDNFQDSVFLRNVRLVALLNYFSETMKETVMRDIKK